MRPSETAFTDGRVECFADFEPALRFTGEWWKQLFGESEGKEGKALFQLLLTTPQTFTHGSVHTAGKKNHA